MIAFNKTVLTSILYFIACWCHGGTNDPDSIDWKGLDLTGTYYKQHASTNWPLWLSAAAGTGGLAVLGFSFAGNKSDTSNELSAKDDLAVASCGENVEINILTNDSGKEPVITGLLNIPNGLQIDYTRNGIISILDVGNESFEFQYAIEDLEGKVSSASVIVEVQSSPIQASDDSYQITAGQELENNLLSNDTGEELKVLNHTSDEGGILEIDDIGNMKFIPENDFCGLFQFQYFIMDACKKRDSAAVSIRVPDLNPPEIRCPENTSVNCSDLLSPEISGLPTVSDFCDDSPEVTYSDILQADICEDKKTIERAWVVVDDSENQNQCLQIITVSDNTSPEMTCPGDVSINCGLDPNPGITGSASALDNCTTEEKIVISYTDTYGNNKGCTNENEITREWRGVDICGNMTTCSQKISFVDNVPPALRCPPDIVLRCGEQSLPSITGYAEATDNCAATENIAITYSDEYQNNTLCAGSISIKRTWKAEDLCGNFSICSQNIIFNDTDPPSLQCPPDISLACGENQTPSNTGRAIATDNCTATNQINISYTDNMTGPSGCAEDSRIERLWTATDACNNTTTCRQVLYLAPDTEPPSIRCPQTISIECEDETDPEMLGYPSISDNCSSGSDIALAYSDDFSNFSDCNGEIRRTWTAIDACSNQNQCTQIIRIRDDVDPTISCPEDLRLECDQSQDPSATGIPEFSDNCTTEEKIVISYTDTYGNNKGCTNENEITREWRGTDICGNMTTCSQKISFVDNVPPALRCPPDMVLRCGEQSLPSITGYAEATDNCAATENIAITYSDEYQNNTLCAGSISIKRTWKAEDLCGNFSICSQNIIFNDTDPPSLQCPPDISLACGENQTPSNTGRAIATDNCTTTNQINISYTDNMTGPSGCAEDSRIERLWTATDACNNTTTCRQVLYLAPDTEPPSIRCPQTISIECEDETDPEMLGYPSISDNCSSGSDIALAYSDDFSNFSDCNGEIRRTWTAIDACSNQNQCTQIIRIRDDVDPTISCPEDLRLECDQSQDPSATGIPEFSDNCTPTDLLTFSYYDEVKGQINCDKKGEILRNWSVTDLCNNSSGCVQTIKVKKGKKDKNGTEELDFGVISKELAKNENPEKQMEIDSQADTYNELDSFLKNRDMDVSDFGDTQIKPQEMVNIQQRIRLRFQGFDHSITPSSWVSFSLASGGLSNLRFFNAFDFQTATHHTRPIFGLDFSVRKQLNLLEGMPFYGLGAIYSYSSNEVLSADGQIPQYSITFHKIIPYFSVGSTYFFTKRMGIDGEVKILFNCGSDPFDNSNLKPAFLLGLIYLLTDF